jgi:3-oxoacyl-[acyl-carrier protein] reductase
LVTQIFKRPDWKVAIVTGGGRNIGRAIALELHQKGTAVVVCARSQAELDVTAGIIQEQGGTGVAIRADVTQEQDVAHVIDAAKELFGRVDYLVNNAGCYLMKSIEETSLAEWQQTLALNLQAPFLMTRAVLPLMKAQGGGRIVNVSSLFGVTPGAKVAAYVASKSGLIGLTRALAKELRPFHITVNAVCPGSVNTTEESAALEDKHWPFGEHLLPRDVAESVAYLISDAASQISGSVIEIPGGTDFEVRVHAPS